MRTTDHGSSPLTRGKRFSVGAGLRIVRLIPAHAGKTTRMPSTASSREAHPRSRGENNGTSGTGVDFPGSSPLTRGKPAKTWQDTVKARLIPAHAGKTPEVNVSHFTYPAHPRSRGENELNELIGDSDQGSSPLTRGKRAISSSYSAGRGLIPAHAGKTRT